MNVKYLSHLKDNRVDCFSVMAEVVVEEYLTFIKHAYENKGGIENQRSPLRTKSAQRIRKRLIEDLAKGTVIPPIVLGLRMDDNPYSDFVSNIPTKLHDLFNDQRIFDQISIIDGMQRTTALYETEVSSLKSSTIRIELWVATTTNSLMYRMLVLNSGQIPWSLKKQLEVVFRQFKAELTGKVNCLKLNDTEDNARRARAGEFQTSAIVELYMLFGAKRIFIDLQEALAEEFARLDIIETSGNEQFMNHFIGIMDRFVKLDILFSNAAPDNSDIVLTKFNSGISIFTSQPARAGFTVAASQAIYGIPGVEIQPEIQNIRYNNLIVGLDAFLDKCKNYTPVQIRDMIDLVTLDESVKIPSSKVGEFERNFFLSAFKTMFDLAMSYSLVTLEPCWRSKN